MLDAEALDELRAMVGEKFNLIIQTYLNNGDDCMAQIAAGVAAQDKTRIVKAAHAFRSASGQVGAARLENYLGELEENNDIILCQNIFPQAQTEYAAVRTELLQLIN